MPSSSVRCTTEALHVLHELAVPTSHEFVTGAVDWLVAAFDPRLDAWRQVTEEAEAYPHAPHWQWQLHADGTRWPVGVLPRAEVLSHLWRSSHRVPKATDSGANDDWDGAVGDLFGADAARGALTATIRVPTATSPVSRITTTARCMQPSARGSSRSSSAKDSRSSS
jgi:hypothetical protein